MRPARQVGRRGRPRQSRKIRARIETIDQPPATSAATTVRKNGMQTGR